MGVSRVKTSIFMLPMFTFLLVGRPCDLPDLLRCRRHREILDEESTAICDLVVRANPDGCLRLAVELHHAPVLAFVSALRRRRDAQRGGFRRLSFL